MRPRFAAVFPPVVAAILQMTIAATAMSGRGVTAQESKAKPTPLLEIALRAEPRARSTKHIPGCAPTVENALQWLLRQQQADGHWRADDFLAAAGDEPVAATGCSTSTIAITGLALFALAREGPAAAGDPRREPMLRAAQWLARRQSNEVIGDATSRHFVYGHAIGLLGLCATVAATGDEDLRDPIERAYRYLERHRNPYSVWRYEPRDRDNDTSVTTWAVLSYLAANDIGVSINGNALLFAKYHACHCTDAHGVVGYTRVGQPSARAESNGKAVFPPELPSAMTAAGLLCRLTSGEALADPMRRPRPDESTPLRTSLAAALAALPEWRDGPDGVDLCQWFLTAEALRIVDRLEPEPASDDANQRTKWRTLLAAALIQGQRGSGADAGSWPPTGPWGATGGRVYSTTMALLALQSLYRLPTTPAGASAPVADPSRH